MPPRSFSVFSSSSCSPLLQQQGSTGFPIQIYLAVKAPTALFANVSGGKTRNKPTFVSFRFNWKSLSTAASACQASSLWPPKPLRNPFLWGAVDLPLWIKGHILAVQRKVSFSQIDNNRGRRKIYLWPNIGPAYIFQLVLKTN